MIIFKACKHLDYETQFTECHRQILVNGKMFWMGQEGEAYQNCKLRGRLNHIDACHDWTKKMCPDFEITNRYVDVKTEDLELD